MPQRVRTTLGRDPGALLGLADVAAHLLGGIRGRAIPDAVATAPGEILDVLHPAAQEKSPAAKDLPHAVGRARASDILFGVGVGAEGDRRALDDLRESAAMDRAPRDRQIGRGVIPAGAANLQPSDAAYRPEHGVAVRVLAGAHEADVGFVPGEG